LQPCAATRNAAVGGESSGVRNRALHDQLRAFSERCAERLATALESGAEIPFEVGATPGGTSTLYRYRPLSAQFVRERLGELRALDGYGASLLALARVENLSAYLRALGSTYVPASERDRSEVVLREFIARLFEDVTAFEFDEQRFERAYRELESILHEDTAVTVVLAPMPGVRLVEDRWELGSGLSLVRGDRCEAPPEAVWGEGRSEREPATLVLLTVEAAPKEPPPLTSARIAFRKLLTAMRLLKPGPARLGPTAWWRVDDGPWQALPLGFAGRARAGDYVLEPAERHDLVELFEIVRERPLQGGALPWALSRFEIGCEQRTPLEGLSDHLLALRALLDADEPTPADVSMRLAALCAERAGRGALRARIDQAFRLQSLLMRGELDGDYLEAAGWDSPNVIALELEQHLRAVLRDMACGYLDPDVKRMADDLLAGEPGRSEEPSSPKPEPPPRQRRAKKAQPVVERWDEVAEAAAPPEGRFPEPEIEVRRVGSRAGGESKRSRRAKEVPAAEQPTQETVPVGAFGESWSDDELDWGFDDDPSDFSAAV
jgi:hypothetical protein